MNPIKFENLPSDASDAATAVLKTRITHGVEQFLLGVPHGSDFVATLILEKDAGQNTKPRVATSIHAIESNGQQTFAAEEPHFDWDSLKLPNSVSAKIASCLATIECERTIFEEWGLHKIQKFRKQAINLYGKPGTGKTHAAHCIASRLGRKIIVTSYAEIASRYVGDGAKNVAAAFAAARDANAVLLVDESDILLYKRNPNASQGSETAGNSITIQFLLELERHQGIVLFATNLIESYDEAFDTRMMNIEIPLPDECLRKDIWIAHLPDELPIADDVDVERLSKHEGLCGRDIRNLVVNASSIAAHEKSQTVEMRHFDLAVEQIQESKSARTRKYDIPVESIKAAFQRSACVHSDAEK